MSSVLNNIIRVLIIIALSTPLVLCMAVTDAEASERSDNFCYMEVSDMFIKSGELTESQRQEFAAQFYANAMLAARDGDMAVAYEQTFLAVLFKTRSKLSIFELPEVVELCETKYPETN